MMTRKTFGKSLAARPAVGEPNEIFVDMSTAKEYVFEDGGWLELPVKGLKNLPAVTASDNGKIMKVDAEGKWVTAYDSDSELPTVTAEDEGKVLKVDNTGKWAKGSEAVELPTVTAEDEGRVLKVDNTGKWAKGSEAVELPAVTAADAGKVLTVSADGVWVAAALPSGE